MSGKSAEQQARDLLEQCGVEDAQSFSAGDVVALANLIAEVNTHRRQVSELTRIYDAWCSATPGDRDEDYDLARNALGEMGDVLNPS
jgi:hypothetical protein